MFTGFPDETIRFFLDLRFHNSAEWYNENRERYRTAVQAPFYAFIEAVLPTLQAIEPQVEIRPHKVLARLRRDTRFTKDKSPFRDHLWIWFRRAGEPREGSVGFWFELGPDHMWWGMGTWGENKPMMERFHREVAADPLRVERLIAGCGLAERGLRLSVDVRKRLPVPANVPERLADLCRAKELYVARSFDSIRECYSPGLVELVTADWKAAAPIYRMLRGFADEAAEAEAAAQAETAAQAAPSGGTGRVDEW